MITVLRLFSLTSGIVLAGSVPFLLFSFAASVGDLDGLPISSFVEPLAYTIPVAAGNIIVGLPNLVSGERNPVFRVIGGALLVFTTASIVMFAVVMTHKATFFWPILWWAAFQVVLFAFFVWPASRFKLANTALQGTLRDEAALRP